MNKLLLILTIFGLYWHHAVALDCFVCGSKSFGPCGSGEKGTLKTCKGTFEKSCIETKLSTPKGSLFSRGCDIKDKDDVCKTTELMAESSTKSCWCQTDACNKGLMSRPSIIVLLQVFAL